MRMKILLIDDDLDLSNAIVRGLEKDYEMEVAYNYTDGIMKAKTFHHQIILLDVQLPDGNGLDFIREIRQYVQTPILLLSVIEDDRTVVQGLDLGADDYITKPFRIEVLKARIQSCIRRYHPLQEQLICGELTIDIGKQKVYKNHQEISLTAIEKEIFFALVSSRGKILTREYLLETFWDQKNRFVEDNTLSVTMRRLKSKIGKEYILTQYNVGYYFKDH